MLHALMDGRALTATELAFAAGITPQTASGHLARLTEAQLLAVERQGRHRYHRIADRGVARMVESIMQVASTRRGTSRPVRTGPRDLALRTARTCYDHLAGGLGVALADALVEAGHAVIEPDAGLITACGQVFLSSLGIELPGYSKPNGNGRVLCRPCLDWSERRAHLGGSIGALLCSHCLEAGWVRRLEDTRAVAITPTGEVAFRRHFGIDAAKLGNRSSSKDAAAA